MEKINSEELSEYVSGFLKGVLKGVTDDCIIKPSDPIEFELAIVNKGDKGGKLNIQIADVSGKHRKEDISKVKFKISKKPENLYFSIK